ncbi:unnamed protein product, partial [Thlaspi arvense]
MAGQLCINWYGLEGDSATIQVYEETAGLMVNDPVLRTHKVIILYGFCKVSIKKTLKTIAKRSGDVYIPRGVSVPALDKDTLWEFQPKKIGEGDLLTGGDLYLAQLSFLSLIRKLHQSFPFSKLCLRLTVFENSLMQHHVALPPDSMGKITYIAPAGQYSLKDTVLEIEFQGVKKQFTMLQNWPVRTPRPVQQSLLLILLFLLVSVYLMHSSLSVLGGTCAIPGAFGCGKTVISQALSKYSNSDTVVYVGCGERGNEMAEVLMDFPQLTMTLPDGREESVMKAPHLWRHFKHACGCS